jgi:hypothetical protein
MVLWRLARRRTLAAFALLAAALGLSGVGVTGVFAQPARASGSGKIARPAWKTIPASALVSNHDRASGAANELAMARHAGAQITRITGSHVVMLSHPDAVVQLVDTAAAKYAAANR